MAKVVDLFCGIGGLTNGLEQAGLDVVAGIDFDPSCQYAYEKNNNGEFIHNNISEVKKEELDTLFGDDPVKILVGCAPCQPFSNFQKEKMNRKGHKDWGLLYEFLRLIQEINPTVVSMENVPILAKEDVFDGFVYGLKEMGYHITYSVHNAADYGMAQRRLRLLLLASRLGNIDFINDKEKSKALKDIIGKLPKIEAGMQSKEDRYHMSSKLSSLNLERIRNSVPGGTWEDWDESLIPNCYKKKTGQTFKSVYGRMHFNSIAPTLTTQFYSYGTGRFGHPSQDRAISIREGALLQSFPDNYEFTPKNERVQISVLGRQIGNAVPPRIGLHIGRSIMKHLKDYNLE